MTPNIQSICPIQKPWKFPVSMLQRADSGETGGKGGPQEPPGTYLRRKVSFTDSGDECRGALYGTQDHIYFLPHRRSVNAKKKMEFYARAGGCSVRLNDFDTSSLPVSFKADLGLRTTSALNDCFEKASEKVRILLSRFVFLRSFLWLTQ